MYLICHLDDLDRDLSDLSSRWSRSWSTGHVWTFFFCISGDNSVFFRKKTVVYVANVSASHFLYDRIKNESCCHSMMSTMGAMFWQVLMEVLGEKLSGFSCSPGGAEEEECRKLRTLWGQAWQRTSTQVGLAEGLRWLVAWIMDYPVILVWCVPWFGSLVDGLWSVHLACFVSLELVM